MPSKNKTGPLRTFESRARCSNERFIQLFKLHGPRRTAEILKVSIRNVFKRRANLAKAQHIPSPSEMGLMKEYPQRATLKVQNGVVIVGSDFHIWPGSASPALRAFKKFCKDLQPVAVILNGDVLDFPLISRHGPIMWESSPMPIDELEAAQDHLNDIVNACGKAHKIWTMGNHDARFESFIAQHAPQMEGVKGFELADHFALWKKVWSCWINEDVVIKHRWKGGIHAPYNNTVNAGRTMLTGHLHSQKITPFTDYNGTRYGIDTGCVAEPDHQTFVNYTEDNPKNWVSGFVVLKFHEGRLMYPELVTVWDDNHVQYLGELIKI